MPSSEQHDSASRMEQILEQILETMHTSTAFPPVPGDLASKFWADYHRIANEHDNELVERHVSNMDGLLIFAGLFSAVSSAFIIAMQPNSNPGSSSTSSTNDLLRLLVLHTINSTVAPRDILSTMTSTTSAAAAPGSIWIQSLSYAGLFASLLAAFGAVLAKQWLAHFKSSRWGRGSFEDRCKRRQAKVDGLENWYFNAVLDTLPTLLHISFLLFGIALGANVWLQEPTVAAVIFGATALAGGFYVCAFFASFLSVDCPYQTPVAAAFWAIPPLLERVGMPIFESLPEPISVHISNLLVRVRMVWTRVSALRKVFSIRRAALVYTLPVDTSQVSAVDLVPERLVSLGLPDGSVDLSTTSAVRWILETSTDPNTVTTAALMIPQLEWPLGYDVYAACHQLRSIMPDKLHFDSDLPEDHVYRICARAVVHLKCITDSPAVSCEIWNLAFSGQSRNLELHQYFIPSSLTRCLMEASSVLPFILGQLDVKQAWMDVAIDVVSKLLPMRELPEHVLVDCLLCAGLLLGVRIAPEDLIKRNKSVAKCSLATSVMIRFQDALPKPDWDPFDYSFTLRDASYYAKTALQLLVPLSYLPSHGILSNPDKKESRELLVWSLKLFSGLLDDMPVSDAANDNDAEGRAALRLGLSWVFGSERDGSQISPWDHYEGLSIPQRGLGFMADYLDRLLVVSDYPAITAVFLVLSNGCNIDNCRKQITYFNAIISCMKADKPSHIRLWALKAACDAVDDLLLVNDNRFQTKLSSVLYEASSVDYRPSEWETTNSIFPYLARDRCYLSLLGVLVNDPGWRRNLATTGNFQRCFAIAQDAWNHPKLSDWDKFRYVERTVDIFTRAKIGAGDAQSAQFMLATALCNEDFWTLIIKAWDIVVSVFCDPREYRLPYYEDLRPFIRYTIQCWSVRNLAMNPDTLKGSIQRTIDALKDDFRPEKRPGRTKRHALPEEMFDGAQTVITDMEELIVDIESSMPIAEEFSSLGRIMCN